MSIPSLVDSHAHLDGRQFANDLNEVIERAVQTGVNTILTIGCDLESSRASVDLALRYSGVYASVGVHPHDASTLDRELLDELERMAEAVDKVVAIGEIGLDFYRDRSPRDIQRAAFRKQVRLARKLGKPVIVHDRDAHEEVLQILREENAAEVGGVLHCFSGDIAFAYDALELGFFLGVDGPITYPNAHGLRSIFGEVPLDRILLETDCPYLAPQARRGKRNEPAYLTIIAEKIAAIKGVAVEKVARITSDNAQQLFALG